MDEMWAETLCSTTAHNPGHQTGSPERADLLEAHRPHLAPSFPHGAPGRARPCGGQRLRWLSFHSLAGFCHVVKTRSLKHLQVSQFIAADSCTQGEVTVRPLTSWVGMPSWCPADLSLLSYQPGPQAPLLPCCCPSAWAHGQQHPASRSHLSPGTGLC